MEKLGNPNEEEKRQTKEVDYSGGTAVPTQKSRSDKFELEWKSRENPAWIGMRGGSEANLAYRKRHLRKLKGKTSDPMGKRSKSPNSRTAGFYPIKGQK